MVSFENTEVAFSGKNNFELNRSYWLFRILGKTAFVNGGKVLSEFAIKLRLPIKGIIKATIFKQFCGGETITACEQTIDYLHRYNIGTILDYSVEGKSMEPDFERTALETIETIKKAKDNKSIPFCVFKVTGIARFELLEKVNTGQSLNEQESQEFSRINKRVDSICKTAHDLGVRIFIDAEESWIQDTIDKMAEEMMRRYNKHQAIVYNTFQHYRHDRLDYLKRSLKDAEEKGYFLGAKLVRGAYMEKERKRAAEKNYPSPIQKDKEATDKDYNEALKFCILNNSKVSICAGSHNESSSYLLLELMKEKGLKNNDETVYFSQLLGMSDHISFNLANAGYNVAKYVPYGPVKEVIPYLIRRAQENTSVKGQTGRELSLIIKEKARRRAGS